MSDVFALLLAAALGYVGVGAITLTIYDHAVGGEVTTHREAWRIVAGWPMIGFVVVAGLYAMWATQHELDKL